MPETVEQSNPAQGTEVESGKMSLDSVFQPYEDQPETDDHPNEGQDIDGNPPGAADQAGAGAETDEQPKQSTDGLPKNAEQPEGLVEVTLDDGSTERVSPAMAKHLEQQRKRIESSERDYKNLQGYDTRLSQELKALQSQVSALQQNGKSGDDSNYDYDSDVEQSTERLVGLLSDSNPDALRMIDQRTVGIAQHLINQRISEEIAKLRQEIDPAVSAARELSVNQKIESALDQIETRTNRPIGDRKAVIRSAQDLSRERGAESFGPQDLYLAAMMHYAQAGGGPKETPATTGRRTPTPPAARGFSDTTPAEPFQVPLTPILRRN